TGGIPRRPSLPPSSITTTDGVCAASSAGRRAAPPAEVSPLTDALYTFRVAHSPSSFCSSRLTQPADLSMPYAALILSPTTRMSADAMDATAVRQPQSNADPRRMNQTPSLRDDASAPILIAR